MNANGKFIISLDFELIWGMRDKTSISKYGLNILGVREVIPRLLKYFDSYNIHATFATVGFLFASNKDELIKNNPKTLPYYKDSNLTPYDDYLEYIGQNEGEDPYHYANSLVNMIHAFPNQEISTHTYSHYFCLEPGQSKLQFKCDLESAVNIAKSKNIKLKSIIFPRNQFNQSYLEILEEFGIESYRGNEKAWYYRATKDANDVVIKRGLRLLDSYINLSGNNCYSFQEIAKSRPYNIPSSRFLRPYSVKLKLLENLRLNRILKSMTKAAKNNQVFHLWWHPHNFGVNQNENFNFLEKILQHYKHLQTEYKFESINMRDFAEELNKLNTKL